jgi:hypothetical protein
VGRVFYDNHSSDDDNSEVDYHTIKRTATVSGVRVVYVSGAGSGDDDDDIWEESWVQDHLVAQ